MEGVINSYPNRLGYPVVVSNDASGSVQHLHRFTDPSHMELHHRNGRLGWRIAHLSMLADSTHTRLYAQRYASHWIGNSQIFHHLHLSGAVPLDARI